MFSPYIYISTWNYIYILRCIDIHTSHSSPSILYVFIKAEGPNAWPRDLKWWEARDMAGKLSKPKRGGKGRGSSSVFVREFLDRDSENDGYVSGGWILSAKQQDACPTTLLQIMHYMLAVMAQLSITPCNKYILDRKGTPEGYLVQVWCLQ